MSSIMLLAQVLPSAGSGVDWLYQFTNNLTNLTTQNGGALTQLGMSELACISFFMLVSMVVNWQTSTMTFRLHHHPIQAGDLTKFLLRLIICCLLVNYWVTRFLARASGSIISFLISPRRWSQHLTKAHSIHCFNCSRLRATTQQCPASPHPFRYFATSSSRYCWDLLLPFCF